MLSTSAVRNKKRPGVVLLVVIAMLALFATVALSFVFYAEAEATASRYANQVHTQAQADIDPELLLSYFLSQLIYDTDNLSSSMRGHSLARNMYGYNPSDYNVTPYNGLGRLRYDMPLNLVQSGGNPTNKKNNIFLINYEKFNTDPLRNPETDGNGNYVGGNVHWTYPDLNNMFLAAVSGDGEVLMPSFFRPWLKVAYNSSSDPWAKYMTLRPHISYHNQFSSPEFAWHDDPDNINNPNPNAHHYLQNLDVKNLEWGYGTRLATGGFANNDSIWMDLGFPVQTAPNGKRYKPLFAPLIVDLDSKINLAVHGNIMEQNQTHFSNLGYGPWEVNLSKVLNADQTGAVPPKEWKKLFVSTATAPSTINKYGADNIPDQKVPDPMQNLQLPVTPTSPPFTPPYYSQVDFGGLRGAKNFATANSPSPIWRFMFLPGDTYRPNAANSRLASYPDYPPNWNNAINNPPDLEIQHHAAGYNPYAPPTSGAKDDKVALVLSHLEALYRYQGTGSPAMTSDLFLNLPNNMQNPPLVPGQYVPFNSKPRWLSTVLSMDMDRPGLMPSINKQASAGFTYQYNPTQSQYPTAAPAGGTPLPLPPSGSATGEFDANLQSNVLTKTFNGNQKLRVLLNRNLTPYPLPGAGNLINTTIGALALQNAVQDRQNMATEILNVLIEVSGVKDPRPITPTPPPTSPDYQAARWLAQLAVNIVDFIDEDDYSTPFNWCATDYVFGTELPQLLLNEIYAQIDNDPSDTTSLKKIPPTATNYLVSFWIELHNPLKNVPSQNHMLPRDHGWVNLNSGGNNSPDKYRILITQNFKDQEPVSGPKMFVPGSIPPMNPTTPPSPPITVSFPSGAVVKPANITAPPPQPYSTVLGADFGLYVVGPSPPTIPAGLPVAVKNTLKNRIPTIVDTTGAGVHVISNLSFQIPAIPSAQIDNQNFGILLQRLANPNLIHQENPLPKSTYNPFITVDYVNNITTRSATAANQPPGYPPLPSLNNGVFYDTAGPVTNTSQVSKWHSIGRKQPYKGSLWVQQKPNPAITTPGQPQHTFYRHNGTGSTLGFADQAPPTLDPHFFWPVHMDRALVNPMELLNVSCCPPWAYTQKFAAANPAPGSPPTPPGPTNTTPGDHRHAWDDPNTLLYRFLELTQVPNFISPEPTVAHATQGNFNFGGRITGKININTIWDSAILDALVDDPTIPFPGFFQKFLTFRSGTVSLNPPGGANPNPPNLLGVPWVTDEIDLTADHLDITTPTGDTTPAGLNMGATPTANQKKLMNIPFKSLNVGNYSATPGTQYPNGLGIQNTILRGSIGNTLFQVPTSSGFFYPIDASNPSGQHYYDKNRIISKIYNNVTTRSNVFAVWLTVGFFEVVDETVSPPKLGAEIGRDVNRNIRHRMFAIVDRTNLLTKDPSVAFNTTLASNSIVNSQTQISSVSLKQTSWNISSSTPGQANVNFNIRPGMNLKINNHTITVLTVDHNTNVITAKMPQNFNAGTAVIGFSHPRPIPPAPGPSNVPGSVYGNPGPQDGAFNVRQNTMVVPYFSIIQ